MSRFWGIILLLPVALLLLCSPLENPFDQQSPNHVSDTTLTRLYRISDSTFIDTSVYVDTVFHCDTIIKDSIRIRDSIRIIISTHFDTVIVPDTMVVYDSVGYIDTLHIRDTIHFKDTSFIYDTLIHYDSIGYIDTLHIRDTIHYRDTVKHYDTLVHFDTLVHMDTTHFRDTVHLRDTVHFRDTLTHLDTLVHLDTLIKRDTIHVRDTTHFRDTVHFRDTIYHYDTLVHRDTLVDTVYYYKSNPFIYLAKAADSSVFSSYTYGQTYSLIFRAAGIRPSIVRSFAYQVEGSSTWSAVTFPWSRQFNTAGRTVYNLRIVTDSGTFANTYTVYCSSAIRGFKPTFQEAVIWTPLGTFNRHTVGYFPVCTLWTDSAPFGVLPDQLYNIVLEVYFSLSGCTRMEFYYSRFGSYNRAAAEDYYDSRPIEYEISDVPIGFRNVTTSCRCTAPDTSLYSDWFSFPLVIRDGR